MHHVRLFWLLIAVFIGGCHDHPHPHETDVGPHLQQYLKLKTQNPDSALIELKAHAQITFKAHPKANEWAEFAARLDRAEKASLDDIRNFSHIALEIAKDNKSENDYIQELEDNILLWDELEKELEAEGRDPAAYYIPFRLMSKEK